MSWPAFTPKQVADYIGQKRSIFYAKADEPAAGPHELVEAECRGFKVIRRYATKSGVDVGTWVESMVAQQALKAGVSVPHVRTFDGLDQVGQDEKGTYQTLWRISGVPLAEVTDREVRLRVYAELGRQLARLHSIEATGAGFVYPSEERVMGVHSEWGTHLKWRLHDHIAAFSEIAGITQALYVTISEAVCKAAQIRFVPTLLHGDLSDRNVMVDATRSDAPFITLIDWEDAIIGDPVYDLANWATFHDAEEADWPVLFNAYYAGRGRWDYRPWDFDLRFWTYYLRISLSKLVVLHKAGHTDLTRGRARIDRALKALNA